MPHDGLERPGTARTADGGEQGIEHRSRLCLRNDRLPASRPPTSFFRNLIVDLTKGGSFGFLGFEFRRVRSRWGRWMPLRLPQCRKRTALLRKLKECFRRFRSQPTRGLIEKLNPILRGWINYFAAGHSSRCFSFIRNWVEQKIRRHLAKSRLRRGFGWKRWSRQWLYETLGLFNDYRVRYQRPSPKVAPS